MAATLLLNVLTRGCKQWSWSGTVRVFLGWRGGRGARKGRGREEEEEEEVGECCDALNHLFPKRDESNKQPEDPRQFFFRFFFPLVQKIKKRRGEKKEKEKPME